MLLVTAEMTLKSDAKEAFLQAVTDVLDPSRAEVGCIAYQVATHIGDPTKVMFVETWRDQDALDSHFLQPYFLIFQERLADLLADTPTGSVHTITASRQL